MNDETRERIKLIVRGLYDAQALRIQLDLRIQRLVRDGIMSKKRADGFFRLPFEHFEKAEKAMEKLVWADVKDLPIVKQWLIKVKGIGPRLSGLLIANIADIGRFDTISKLWAYCGLHTKEGRAVKRKKGEKANWSAELKTTSWKIGLSFVKAGGPYRELYDRYKARIIEREINKGTTIWTMIDGKWSQYSHGAVETNTDDASHAPREAQYPNASQVADETQNAGATREWTLGRINNMAIRFAVKMFLSHLWQVWREIEGLPVREPYAIEYLGHTTKLDPWDFITEKAA